MFTSIQEFYINISGNLAYYGYLLAMLIFTVFFLISVLIFSNKVFTYFLLKRILTKLYRERVATERLSLKLNGEQSLIGDFIEKTNNQSKYSKEY